MDPIDAQRELLEIVVELQHLDHRLQRLVTRLPIPPNQDDMLDGHIPPDVATELQGAISFTRGEHIHTAIEYLTAASRVTEKDLERRFANLERSLAEREERSRRETADDLSRLIRPDDTEPSPVLSDALERLLRDSGDQREPDRQRDLAASLTLAAALSRLIERLESDEREPPRSEKENAVKPERIQEPEKTTRRGGSKKDPKSDSTEKPKSKPKPKPKR